MTPNDDFIVVLKQVPSLKIERIFSSSSSSTNFASQSSKAIKKSMETMSKNPIYNKIIANQSMQSQQINSLIKIKEE